MARYAVLKLIFFANGLEVCTLKRFHEFHGRYKLAMRTREDIHYNHSLAMRTGEDIYYNHSLWLGRPVSSPPSNDCDCDQLIARFNIATGDDVSLLWTEFELSYVSSWHTLNRRHCRLSLMWKTFCEKSICLARCDREQKKDLAEGWARNCADKWQKDADEFNNGIPKHFRLKVTDELEEMEENHSQEQIDLWMKKVTQTFPPCEVCEDPMRKDMSEHEIQEAGLPDACKKENNVHTTVGKLLDNAMTEDKPDKAQLSGNETAVDSQQNWSALSSVNVSPACQHECSQEAQALDHLWARRVGTNYHSEQKFYDGIGYTWVKGWHFMNRMHCYVALASLRWCQRNVCYRTCQESRGTPHSECQATWGGNYTEGVDTLKQKVLEELMARNIPNRHARRWWSSVVRTFEACAPCDDKSVAKSIPQPCWHEYNTYTEVWFHSLPEEKQDKHRGGRIMWSRNVVFWCVVVGLAMLLSVCFCARKFYNWYSNKH